MPLGGGALTLSYFWRHYNLDNNFGREHWWEVRCKEFWEGTLVGGWKLTILGGNIGGEVEAKNFGREHWWEGGS